MSVSLQFLSALFMLAVPISFSSLTSDQKAEILRAHNYFRGRVDPIATDMLRLVSINDNIIVPLIGLDFRHS